MSKKNKKICTILIYTNHLLTVVSAVIGCVPISAFAFLVGIPNRIMSTAVGLKIRVITAGIKKYKSIIKKNKSNSDKIVLLA